MKSSDTFWNSAADKYARRPVSDEAAYVKTLDRIQHYLNTEHHVLEFGCGTGTTALKLSPYAANITGTDIAGRMIEIARKKAFEQNINNVSFQQATLDTFPQHNASFDVVMGFNILHLLPTPETTISHVHEILKPNGLFISKTPCLAEKTSLLRPLIWFMQKIGKAPLVQFISYVALDDMVRAAGFDIIESGIYPAKTGSRFIVAKRL